MNTVVFANPDAVHLVNIHAIEHYICHYLVSHFPHHYQHLRAITVEKGLILFGIDDIDLLIKHIHQYCQLPATSALSTTEVYADKNGRLSGRLISECKEIEHQPFFQVDRDLGLMNDAYYYRQLSVAEHKQLIPQCFKVCLFRSDQSSIDYKHNQNMHPPSLSARLLNIGHGGVILFQLSTGNALSIAYLFLIYLLQDNQALRQSLNYASDKTGATYWLKLSKSKAGIALRIAISSCFSTFIGLFSDYFSSCELTDIEMENFMLLQDDVNLSFLKYDIAGGKDIVLPNERDIKSLGWALLKCLGQRPCESTAHYPSCATFFNLSQGMDFRQAKTFEQCTQKPSYYLLNLAAEASDLYRLFFASQEKIDQGFIDHGIQSLLRHSPWTLRETHYILSGNYCLFVVVADISGCNSEEVDQLIQQLQQSIPAYAPPPLISNKVLFWVGYLKSPCSCQQSPLITSEKQSLSDKGGIRFIVTSAQLLEMAMSYKGKQQQLSPTP